MMAAPLGDNSVSILGQFARPARGHRAHLHRVQTAIPQVYAISTVPHVLHIIQGTTIASTIHVEESIVDVASFDGNIAIAGDRGSIWIVPLPSFAVSKPAPKRASITLSSQHHEDDQGDAGVDPLAVYGQSRHVRVNRKRQLDSTHEKAQYGPIHRVPGVQSIASRVEGGEWVLVALGVLAPTSATTLSMPLNKVIASTEYEALEGEMATCMLMVSSSSNAAFLSGTSAEKGCTALLFQGDVDGQVRVVGLDARKAVLSMSTFWTFKRQRVLQLLPVSECASDEVDAIAILGAQGRLVVVGHRSQVKLDVQLVSPVDSIAYDAGSKQFIYIVDGQCYRQSLTSSSASTVLHHISRGATKVVVGSDPNQVCVLLKSGKVFTAHIQVHQDTERASLKSGTDKALKAEVARITEASSEMRESTRQSLVVCEAIDKINNTRRFLSLCQLQDVRKCFQREVCVKRRHNPLARISHVELELSIRVDKAVAPTLRLRGWRVLVVLREPSIQKTLHYTSRWHDSEPSFSTQISLDPFKLFSAGVSSLEMQCFLAYDDRPRPFHFTLMAASLNVYQVTDAFESLPLSGHTTKTSREESSRWWTCHVEYSNAVLDTDAAAHLPPRSMTLGIWPGQKRVAQQLSTVSAISALLVNTGTATVLRSTLNDLTIKRVGGEITTDAPLISLDVLDSSSLAAIRANVIAALTLQGDASCFRIASPATNARALFQEVSALGSTWSALQDTLLPALDFDVTSQKEIFWLVGQVLGVELELSTLYWSSRKLVH